jgi:hypothetical protein
MTFGSPMVLLPSAAVEAVRLTLESVPRTSLNLFRTAEEEAVKLTDEATVFRTRRMTDVEAFSLALEAVVSGYLKFLRRLEAEVLRAPLIGSA